MAVLSKEEINLRRLLSCCEALANNIKLKDGKINWRLEKYVIALQKQIVELGKVDSKPSKDTMKEYTKRIEFLKHTIDTEKMTCPYKKTVASQQIVPPDIISDRTYATTIKVREIHHKAKTRHQNEARKELLAGPNLKSRKSSSHMVNSEEGFDEIMQHHQNMQEKIAEEMIEMAQNLKHNSLVANDILKKDNKVLDNATRLADSSYKKLKHESERLEEITNRPCSLWLWIMLTCVCMVFISMIIFIRFFPKI
ncbi:vesicle transport protein USE1-like [Xenia sp. Carnegie-2017]|uniref:vesicle transport protein USE1-like n=1 Tax=Xenia sp. Carnegie-2017 TaxID=2897299 RepID=UPI001F037BF8|nr:vesicle transport protein USE1-like [Xenia sp. Carnegie-2017]